MKKICILCSFLLTLCKVINAQQVPLGMQYQAVARDLQGTLLPNREITLRINLVNNEKSSEAFYSEVHRVTTNQLGLFSLVIGSGVVERGNFAAVPWSSENIWMQVAIKDKGKTDFAMISNSKLLAVPYAFHAGTAGQLAGQPLAGNPVSQSANSDGVPSQNWSLFGNRNSDASKDKLGTTDYVDLVLVTNNLERMRILANGDILLKRSLSIGANLSVDSSVFLNKVSGATINYGPFTVDRQSPTLLTGTLTVDKATDLNSSLNVDGITNLNSALNVNNMSPTLLTGTLQVNKDAIFKEKVLLDNPNHNSTSINSGALVVNGGVGIVRNLNVGGDANFGGHTTFAGAVNINDLTQSFSPTTGALIVGGGVGIGKRLNIGGGGFFDSTLRVTGATTLNNTLTVAGITSITNNTSSTNTATGALTVNGGVGIIQNLNVGGAFTATGAATLNSTLAANGQVTITNNPGGNQSAFSSYPLRIQGSGQGIAVKVTGSRTAANNFISFWDDNGMQGRIEGQTLGELHNDDDYKSEHSSRVYDVTSGVIDLLFASTDLAMAISDQVSADASANVCAGLGVVACPPIASLIAGSLVNVGLATAQEVVVIADVAFASVNLAEFEARKDAAVGVSYQSSAGDYAEYLLRDQPAEKMYPGEIVGVKGGKISKMTEGVDKVMVISHKPIVLGKLPQEGEEKNFEKVAFMGQVPVKVFGKVNLGDYIIPNGVNNGIGVAIAPEKIEAKDIKNIVGIAWSSAQKDLQFNMVNVAVGLNVNDNQKIIDRQQKEITELKNAMAQTNSQLERLIPGFKASSMPMMNTSQQEIANRGLQNTAQAPSGNKRTVTYNEISKQDLMQGFEMAQQTARANGVNVEKDAFWKKWNTDPSYKEFILSKVLVNYKNAIGRQKALDSKLN